LGTKNISILKDLIKEKQSPRLNHVVASDLILSQVSLPVGDDLKESLKKIDLTPLEPLLLLSQVFPRVEENRLHIVVQAPTNGESISVILHVTNNLIGVVQNAWVPKTRERREEIRSLPCIEVRVFFLLLPPLINNI
jgi:Crinkler effector protein N-terminal domain